MKKLLLLLAFVPGIGCCVYAQETEKPTVQLQQEVPDSLATVFNEIDQLSVFELEKWKESYIYKCRKEPSEHNSAVLAYIKKRIEESK